MTDIKLWSYGEVAGQGGNDAQPVHLAGALHEKPPTRPVVDGHADLHSELGPNRGEHSGRAINPTIKVTDLAWLEFEKPDLTRAETFARAFGFAVAAREPDALYLRGSLPGTPCVLIRKGAHSRFIGPTFKAGEAADLNRLATATDRRVEPLTDPTAGSIVRLTDPSGFAVGVVHLSGELPALAEQQTQILNFGAEPRRINATQRPPRVDDGLAHQGPDHLLASA